eukprot:TRINITY_DN88009_c1_g1_i1.p1 TRINITY_DN88009_c1_g1~~TRINITY_DN88009_c1_g1_i1.p1  ORF type:complete len:414 (+),score=25.95 TRINITY_DN88009_c1_g1_i1:131-1372(+)
MKAMNLLLMAIILVACIKAEWKAPKGLVGAGTHIKHYSTYMDKTGLKTHIAYCTESTTLEGVVTQVLRYATINSANEIISDTVLSTTSGCRVAKITGDGTEKGLIIAIEGQRIFHLGVCNATNPKGCYDIYVLSSQNSGSTWTDPVPVSRRDLGDTADRLSPHFVVNPATKRVYLFYTYRFVTSEVATIAFVTRPPKSSVFTSEVLTRNPVEEKFVTALPTVKNGRIIIHLFIENKGFTLHVFTENGITWDQNTVLTDGYHFSGFVGDYRVLSEVIIGVCTDGKHSYVAASQDHGISWIHTHMVNEAYHRVSAGMLCKGAEDSKLKLNLLLTSFMQKEQKYLTANIPEGDVQKVDAPFVGIDDYGVFMPQLWCYTSPITKKPAVKAFSYIWTKPNKPLLYVSDNESIQEIIDI